MDLGWGGGSSDRDSASSFIQQIHRDNYCPVDTGMGPKSWGSLSRRETDNEQIRKIYRMAVADKSGGEK